MNVEIEEKLLQAVRRARKRTKKECACGPSYDFIECAVCIAKKALADAILEKSGYAR